MSDHPRTPRRSAALFVDLCATLLGQGFRVRFAAEGRSMIPAVEHGDVLTIGPIDSRSIAPGDIVLLRHRGRPIAHRVEEICPGDDGGTVVIARGDGKAGADAPVGLHDVLGKVVSIDKRARASDRGVALIIPDAIMRLLRRFLRPPAGSRSLELALERARPQS